MTDSLDFRGEIADAPDGLTQAATAPNGKFYVASEVTNNLYVINIEEPARIETIELAPEINISGADLAFAPDRTLYLWTNAPADRGLYTVDPRTGETELVDSSDTPLTGLAAVPDNDDYLLVGSEPNSNNLHIINPDNANIMDTYTFDKDGLAFTHGHGDMTMGQFVVEYFKYRFNTDGRGSWATYFKPFKADSTNN